MKMLSFAICIILVGALSATTLYASSEIALAVDGYTKYLIAVATDALPSERTAVSELKKYLEESTGATFKVVTPDQTSGKPVIAVGPGAARYLLPSINLNYEELGDNGIVIQTLGNNLFLTGARNSRRGTLYAVHEFMERHVGVRWWTSTEEFVPLKPILWIPNINIRYIPTLQYRDIMYQDMMGTNGNVYSHIRMSFAARMKLNGHYSGISKDWGGNWSILGWCHTFYALMPPDKYFKDHPDWYSEIDGKRQWEGAQLCCTNNQMIAELTKNVLDKIRNNPDAGIIDVSQNDGGINCQCEKCRKMDSSEGSASGSLIYCINRIAESVEKVYPDYQVEFIAYQYSRKPPKYIKPAKNVIVRLCVIERSCMQPIDSKQNKALFDDLKAWKKVAPKLMLWDYTDQLSCSLIPHPNENVFAPDFRTYVKNNVMGVFCEGDNWTLPVGDDELKHYIMAHLLWNPNQDTRLLINDFIDGYYGDAAPMIRKYIDRQMSAVSNTNVRWETNTETPRNLDAVYMSLEDMNLYTQIFNEAEKRVKADPVILKRVKRIRVQVDNQWVSGYARYKREAILKHIRFLGPESPLAAVDELVSNAKSLGVWGIAWDKPLNIDTYAANLRKYYAYYNSPETTYPLPSPFANISTKDMFDIQEQDFDLFGFERGDASFVKDPLASNKTAALLNPEYSNWAVQINNLDQWNHKGIWHAYAVIRIEKIADRGVAFVGGVYNQSRNRSDMDMIVQLDPSDRPKKDDPTVLTPNIDFRDGAYHVVDLGSYEIGKDRLSFWFGTTGGVSPNNVKGIYIDRVFFIKGK